MNKFRRVFPCRHTVLPVIHAQTLDQCARNAKIAHDAGADGVWLVNHSISRPKLLAIQGALKEAHPDWWVGVNCLGYAPQDVFPNLPDNVDGVWVDNAGIVEGQDEQIYAGYVQEIRRAYWGEGPYFGGVAFKYQRPVADFAGAARSATSYMDVVTTSGPGTGQSASLEKIRVMRAAIGDRPLAIASGITPENVGEYLPYADCFLVATGISSSFEELDPARVALLISRVRAGGGDV